MEAMQRGKKKGLHAIGSHAVAVGVAVESIEAWTLGATEALAEELRIPIARVRHELQGLDLEKLRESSGKVEHRPKSILDRLAKIAHRSDETELRAEVASRTKATDLEAACPRGFAPFAQELRKNFGTVPAASSVP
jgi:hypothetical protein